MKIGLCPVYRPSPPVRSELGGESRKSCPLGTDTRSHLDRRPLPPPPRPRPAMSASDLKISVSIRMVLVRHRVDVQQVIFNSFRGTVRVQGRLVSLGTEDPITPARIETMESEMKRVHDVEHVFIDVEGWTKNDEGHWQPREDARRRGRKDQKAERAP